jgi:AbiV family abortive infection protein
MGKSSLNPYKGSLKPDEIAAGMNAARRNAKRLCEDAELLIKNDRYSSATCMAILAIEEAGKLQILRELALARDGKEIKDAWKSYRSHTSKNVTWILPSLVSKGAKTLEDFREIFDSNSDHPQILDQLKQVGFYTDCLGKKHWSEPGDVINKETATSILKVALISLAGNEVTAREIELWIKHMGPVWKGDMDWMKKALENWYSDMESEGLSDHDAERINKYLYVE